MAEKLWNGIKGQEFVAKRAHRDALGNVIDETYTTKAYVDNKVGELAESVAEDIVSLQETKLDTTAFASVSGTFLTDQALDDYLTKEDAESTYQPLGDYMDADALEGVSGRWEDTADLVDAGKDTWDTVTAKADKEYVDGELDRLDDADADLSAAIDGKVDTGLFVETTGLLQDDIDTVSGTVDELSGAVSDISDVVDTKLDTTAFSTVSGEFVSADYPHFSTCLEGPGELTISSSIGYAGKSTVKVVDKSTLSLEAAATVSAYADSLAVGPTNKINTAQSFALGINNSAGQGSISQGIGNSAVTFAIAQGNGNSAGSFSQAFGYNNVITNTGMAIGKFNKTSADAALVIGNGTGDSDRSDLFVVKHDGTVSSTGDFVTDGKSLSSVYDTVNTYSAGWEDVANKVDTAAFEAATGTLAGAIDTVSAATDVNAEDIATLSEKANELESEIDTISAVIPSDATEQNKLVSTDTLNAKIADFGGFKIADGTGTDQHPDVQNPDTKFIYLVKDDSVSGDDKFKEWIFDNNAWQLVGDTSMDLEGYVQLPDIHTDRNIVVFGPNDDILDGGRKLSDIDDAIDAVSADAREEFDGVWETFENVETALGTKQDVSAMTGYYTVDNPAGYITNAAIAGKVDTSAFDDEIDRVDGDIDFLSAAIDDIPTQVQSDWTEVDNTSPAFILNKPEDIDLSAGEGIDITEEGNALVFSVTGDYATTGDVSYLSGVVDGKVDMADFEDAVSDIGTDIDFLSGAISAIPEQVQSDWTEDNQDSPAYIQNKPANLEMSAGDGIGITEANNTLTFSVTGNYADAEEVAEDIVALSGAISAIPEQVQSDWEETDQDSPAFILNKPEDLDLSAGDYMNITETGNSLEFSVDYPDLSAQVAEDLVHTAVFTIKV